jgi:hypothetical protein
MESLSSGASATQIRMENLDNTQRNGAGAAVEAAEVPGPTFTQEVAYSRLREVGMSPDFIALRSHAMDRKEELNLAERAANTGT